MTGGVPAIGVWILVGAAAAAAEPNGRQLEFFEKQIRPLLVEHCYECHSGQAKRLEAGLRLDSREGVLRGGDSGPAAVPGKPESSLLIQAVRYEAFEMPPRGRLAKERVDALVRWIADGAFWPPEAGPAVSGEPVAFDWRTRRQQHWAWQPIQRPSPPLVRDAAWPRNDIDRFILARLEQEGLPPARDADPRTLIRRLSFDLIGLPPQPEQVARFEREPSPEAYALLVDELLASPHFGEKWARHWMDSVRYAETYGHEFDYAIPHAQRYRDYLIRAWNADVPYNQWILEHLAGDLLVPPRVHPQEG